MAIVVAPAVYVQSNLLCVTRHAVLPDQVHARTTLIPALNLSCQFDNIYRTVEQFGLHRTIWRDLSPIINLAAPSA